MGAYGTSGAAPNETFPFELGLDAARALWTMADEVQSAERTVEGKKADAIVDFLGPKLETFLERRSIESGDAVTVADNLRATADEIAAAWARARGNQDRINHARWVEHQKENRGAGEKFVDWAFGWAMGEKDYGPEPDDPRVPTGGAYRPTRDPIHPEFGL